MWKRQWKKEFHPNLGKTKEKAEKHLDSVLKRSEKEQKKKVESYTMKELDVIMQLSDLYLKEIFIYRAKINNAARDRYLKQ